MTRTGAVTSAIGRLQLFLLLGTISQRALFRVTAASSVSLYTVNTALESRLFTKQLGQTQQSTARAEYNLSRYALAWNVKDSKTMADYTAAQGYAWPAMNWSARDLQKEFERFYSHCEFVFGGPLSKCSEKEKICNLMNFVGDKGREKYMCFEWATVTQGGEQVSQKDILAEVVKRFKAVVEGKKNPILAAVTMDRRVQKPNETFDDFVTDLKLLARDLDFNNEDCQKLIRNAVSCKSADERVRQKCIEKGTTLTLDQAIGYGRMFETTKSNMKVLEGDSHIKVSANRLSKKQNKKPKFQGGNGKQPEQSTKARPGQCGNCGRPQHRNREECPAKDVECHACSRRGHYRRMCRASKGKRKTVNTLRVDSESTDEDYPQSDLLHVRTINTGEQIEEDWLTTLKVGRSYLKFQIDTGARASVMSKQHLSQVCENVKLEPTLTRIVSYSDHVIVPLGTKTLTVKHKTVKVKVQFFIVEEDRMPIISGSASQELGLLKRLYKYNILDQLEELESATGTLPGTFSIKIDPTAEPVVHAPRQQPSALLTRIKKKLLDLEKDGHIVKVTEPTDWVNSMVTSLRGGKVRICVDPTDLNKAIRREHYPMQTVEEIASQISGAKYFSVLDAKSGFLQLKLNYESSLLTTMNTPKGRYRWTRLPFGVKCAPEMFQRTMDEMLDGIENAFAVMDDILIAGKDLKTHDATLSEVLRRANKYNLRLNLDKVKLRRESVQYVGHLITQEGLRADPEKIRAVQEMPRPVDKEGVRRCLGFIQYLSKFLPNLADVTEPLRVLTKAEVQFHWEAQQERAFQRVKDLCTKAPVLAYYDVEKPCVIQCDSSNLAFGAVLLQDSRPVAYASRKLRPAQQKWAPIEKEMAAIVFSVTKFRSYILGKETLVQTDHKPLATICNKPLQNAPLRLQDMLLQLKGYDISVAYLPGKSQFIADALSRASVQESECCESMDNVQVNMSELISVSPGKYQELQTKTAHELNELHAIVKVGWPEKRHQVPHCIRPYWTVRDELAVTDGIIYRGLRIVVPPTMRPRMLELIHESHLGIVKSKKRARDALYWPGMSGEVEDVVSHCDVCSANSTAQAKEPMIIREVPDMPWQEVASDLFHKSGENFILSVDYYSRYIEVTELKDLSAESTIKALKEQFSRQGIPEKLYTDNGPQYASSQFAEFADDYSFTHITFSPRHPQGNGEAEVAVKTMKAMWQKCNDRYKALLNYLSTPLSDVGYSPAQLNSSRRLRTNLPISRELLRPEIVGSQAIKRRLSAKEKQKSYFDKSARELPELKPGEVVRIKPDPGSSKSTWKEATVTSKCNTPRSYLVDTGERVLRRNRAALRKTKSTNRTSSPEESECSTLAEHVIPSAAELEATSTVSTSATPCVTTQCVNQPIAEPVTVTARGRTVRKPIKLDL